MSQLRNRNIIVLGVSADDVRSHRDFSRSERLNFPLLADVTKRVSRAYGILGASGVPRRVTFIIGPDGLIHAVDGNVDAEFTRSGSTLVSRHGASLALLLSDWKAYPGALVPNFFLPDTEGRTVSPLAPGKKAAVIVYLGAKCPLSATYTPALRALADNPAYRDVGFLGIDAGAETNDEVRAFTQAHRLSFAVARDPYDEVSGHFSATVTPSVWVLDGAGRVAYRGAIAPDPARVARMSYLKEALDAVLTGRPVPIRETAFRGTPIPPDRRHRGG